MTATALRRPLVKGTTLFLAITLGLGLILFLLWALSPDPAALARTARADRPSVRPSPRTDLPLGATAEWWAAVQGQLGQELLPASSSVPAAPSWSDSGETSFARFGLSVASAGDVNGDGYADVAVAADGYPNGGARGRVYVYHGSSDGLGSTPALTLTGETSSDRFGCSIASAGDVNGDGYADLVVGAYGRLDNTGRVYVYHGSSGGLASTAAFTVTGENTYDRFGFSVASAGDVNGDGYADLIVGAKYHDGRHGKVYVYQGSSAGLSTTVAFTATGENTDDDFGHAVAPAGDVNGDGYADVIVAANYHDSFRGQVYVYHGSSSGLVATPAFTVTGESTLTWFGSSVAAAGDVNGDGYTDVIVGAHRYGSYNDEGRMYVYHGSSEGLSTTVAFTATGSAGDWLGGSVASAGDVNGDGYADVIVGADHHLTTTGKAQVYHGGSGGLGHTPAFTLTGEDESYYFGASVATAGDVNGDGYADLVVGAYGYDNARGKAYAYHGGGDGSDSTAAFTAAGEGDWHWFGRSAATAGDVNGDGYSDVVVGASDYGKVYVYHGSSAGLMATVAFTVTGEHSGDQFGWSAATAGDVNGDGYADLVVGAPAYPSTGRRGAVYVYHGSSGGLGTMVSFSATGEIASDEFGYAVASAGDVNGDGYGDVIVGAPQSTTGPGAVYVYHGSSDGLRHTPALTVAGKADYDHFGESLASAGDVNGDGYGDVVVGAYGYGSDDAGRVYVYHGSGSGLSATPAFTVTGQSAGEHYGQFVASAGDVNGDGYADVVVGAIGYLTYTGKVHAYHGSASGLMSSPAFTASGENEMDSYGGPATTAGDVNGDGFADVVVGASTYPAEDARGRMYVYHGSSSGLNATPAFTATGETNGDEFGFPAATAGDVNGDGYADVIVAATGYLNYVGRVHVFQGNSGGGRPVLARQARGDGSSVPVQPWGLSHAPDGFEARMIATDPMGRGRVKLQVEACPPGVPFGDASCVLHTSTAWTDVTASASGVSLTETIADLEEGTLYRWRARVLYAPYSVTEAGITPPPNPAHGPWRRLFGQGLEADLRTAYGVYLPLVLRSFP